MKRRTDPRHIKRAQLMRSLFSWNFQKGKIPKEIQVIVSKLPQIDQLIAKAAPDRPIEQINNIDLAILRLAVFELIIKKEAPLKVVIDEAVELAKEFGSESSPKLVNGALGKLVELKKN